MTYNEKMELMDKYQRKSYNLLSSYIEQLEEAIFSAYYEGLDYIDVYNSVFRLPLEIPNVIVNEMFCILREKYKAKSTENLFLSIMIEKIREKQAKECEE